MSEKVRKYRVAIYSDKHLVYCKSFYSIMDAIKYYRKELQEKYPEDKYEICYSSFMTSE